MNITRGKFRVEGIQSEPVQAKEAILTFVDLLGQRPSIAIVGMCNRNPKP